LTSFWNTLQTLDRHELATYMDVLRIEHRRGRPVDRTWALPSNG